MAITIPADLELVSANELLGHIPADPEPLHTLLRRCNWHYATHSPAIVNCCPVMVIAPTQQIIVPAYASADATTYDAMLGIHSSAGGTCTVNIEQAIAGGGPWVAVGAYPLASGALAGLATTWDPHSFALLTTTRFLRITLSAGPGNLQLQSVGIWPAKRVGISSGKKASGFIAYDDAALQVGSGDAPIHTEYFIRAAQNFRVVQADRRQCLWSFVQNPTLGAYGFTSTGQSNVLRIGLAAYHCPVSVDTDVTVYCRAADAGAGTGRIMVGQVGSEHAPVVFQADDTDQTRVLKLDPKAPEIIYALAVAPSGRIDPRYVVVEWTPTIGGATDIVAGVAPPPLREYLVAIDQLGLAACTGPYGVTGLNFNPAIAGTGGTLWAYGQRVAPACYGMTQGMTMSRTVGAGAGTPLPGEMYSASSGAAAADRIVVASSIGGSLVYPPNHAALVDWGTVTKWDAAPAAAVDRIIELTQDREPAWETMEGRYFQGWGGRTLRVGDLSSLP